MCSVHADRTLPLLAIAGADLGVFAYVNRAGRPIACAVTPYLDGTDVLVTSTLALPTKIRAVGRNCRVALLAGGVEVSGRAEVELDETGAEFDRLIRRQELRKYPPSRSLLRLPGHRRRYWWYVGRAIARLSAPTPRPVAGSDRVTLITLDGNGVPTIAPLGVPDAALERDSLDLASPTPLVDGPACVLVHEERRKMTDLRQLRLDGHVRDGTFFTETRRGSLRPGPTGIRAQMQQLRLLARAAEENRPLLARWRREIDMKEQPAVDAAGSHAVDVEAVEGPTDA